MPLEGMLEQGWATARLDDLINWAANRVNVADVLWACLLRS
jgi:cobalamin biosynthesis protein CobD/CbiB